MITGINPDDISPTEVGPGCYRRDLPTAGGVRAWVVDMDAGAEWPRVDQHDEFGEELLVVSGELIEGERTFKQGDYVLYGPHSAHRPRTDTGVRLFGFNVVKD